MSRIENTHEQNPTCPNALLFYRLRWMAWMDVWLVGWILTHCFLYKAKALYEKSDGRKCQRGGVCWGGNRTEPLCCSENCLRVQSVCWFVCALLCSSRKRLLCWATQNLMKKNPLRISRTVCVHSRNPYSLHEFKDTNIEYSRTRKTLLELSTTKILVITKKHSHSLLHTKR